MPSSGLVRLVSPGSGLVSTSRLATGAPSTSTFLRGDQKWVGVASDPLVTIAASGSAYSAPINNAAVVDITLTANLTLAISGVTTGAAWSVTFLLRQDGVGSRTVSWPASTKWPSGVAPTLSAAAGSIDVVTLLTVDGGASWLGFVAGKTFS